MRALQRSGQIKVIMTKECKNLTEFPEKIQVTDWIGSPDVSQKISMVPVRLHIHHLDTTKENLLVTGMTQTTEANRIKISTVTNEDTHRSFRYYV